MDTDQLDSHGPKMDFVRNLVIEFIQDHLYDRDKDPSWLFARLKNDSLNVSDVNDDSEELIEPVLHSLLKLAEEFEEFIDDKYNDRFTELTEPLIPKLKNGSKHKYYDAFKTVADELFSRGISWSHIVTFLVYSAELTNKILELPSQNDKDKTYRMVSQIINSVSRYFDENLTQWIETQSGSWLSVTEYEKTSKSPTSDKDDSTDVKGVRQYIGVAAIAAIIGGLYLCSKLTVQ